MSALPKPELRGHLRRYITKTLMGAFAFSAVNCTLFYYFYMEPRKKAYAEYARTYDAKAHHDVLVKGGYLQAHGGGK